MTRRQRSAQITKHRRGLKGRALCDYVFGLTYLCMDPIVKTVYALRCFYGESITSGEDLKAELKQSGPGATLALAVVVLSLGLAAPSLNSAEAASAAAGESASEVAPAQLDRAIEEIIHQPKYTWRMPREKAAEEKANDGPVRRFFERVVEMLKNAAKASIEWLARMIARLLPRSALPLGGGSSIDWMAAIRNLLILLLVLVVVGLAFLLLRAWSRAKRRPSAIASEAVPMVPDLADENVGAEQLPENGWIKLGRELLERGEFRLALRAFYFASLAHLAARGLITVAKFKSNRDYERELRRRGHALPDLLVTFGDNVLVFDRSWYGMHEVNQELVGQFLANVERIKTVQ